MARERIRITVGELGQKFDLDFSDGKLFDSINAGVHHLCGGFIERRQISETHYALTCGACGLRIVISKDIQAREQILDFFIQKGLHKKGEEVKVCLECEGKKWLRKTSFATEKDWTSGRLVEREKEVTNTVDCPNCNGTGILQKEAVA